MEDMLLCYSMTQKLLNLLVPDKVCSLVRIYLDVHHEMKVR